MLQIVSRGEDHVAVRIGDVVHKIGGRRSANRYDHEALTATRKAGMPWAPQPSLYEIRNEWSDECPVMAMPYLPDDGSQHSPEAWAAMRAQTGRQVDWIGGNVVSRAGLPVVS